MMIGRQMCRWQSRASSHDVKMKSRRRWARVVQEKRYLVQSPPVTGEVDGDVWIRSASDERQKRLAMNRADVVLPSLQR